MAKSRGLWAFFIFLILTLSSSFIFAASTTDDKKTGVSLSRADSDIKFGNNSDIDSGPEDCWEVGGLYTGQPLHSASAETVDVFSGSANDTSAGTGARTVTITGLDGNWALASETLTMNGTSAVTSSGTWHRIFRVQVITAGSGGGNAGVITVRHTTTTANVFAGVAINRSQSAIAAYTVPAGKILRLLRYRVSISRANGSAGSGIFTMRVRREGEVYRAIRNENITTNYSSEPTILGSINLPEKTDIIFRMESVSDTNTQFAGAFEYELMEAQ